MVYDQKNCQICGVELEDIVIDGRLRRNGSWAYMCEECHTNEGVGLGLGKGQKFSKQLKKKIAG
jgi:hypothetical protein